MKIFAKFNKTIERERESRFGENLSPLSREREREIPETIRKHKDILRIMSQEGD